MNATLEIPIVPRRLVFKPEPPLTDEEFEKLCFANDLFQLERTREGKIVVNPPVQALQATQTERSSIN